MASETESSADEEAVAVPAAGAGGTDKRGRHRILAELKRLDQDSKFLQEELEELEKTENVSTICTEVHGPVNLLWDRWFEGPQDTQACRCWIL
ncbi:guanine nucleotide-binding protein subunit gamma 1-like isoform X2 [Vigna unguiculata]|uniref:guanine nucleotide-binding protein subunit gamma 1-like isoform X2 n=1 Tax=Vigna unguiculata TaxID=3917 RepID=UPI0010168425|nr:guanine nucleotide-binding protein subunit gamma 1-like isoform X2 [Vigna unguiculata]